MRRHYLNLSNGLEALYDVRAPGEPWAVCRIRSTTLEHEDWTGLLMVDLDADLLLHLALGVTCVLHDRGTRRPLSKTQYLGTHLVVYLLERYWFGHAPSAVMTHGPNGGPGPDRAAEFAVIYEQTIAAPNATAGMVRKRLDYFGQFAAGKTVWFLAAGGATTHDGDKAFYQGLARALTSG